MRRNFTDLLVSWNKSPNRKPLIVRGMRQTGKTWCVRDFAKRVYQDAFLELNFEFSPRWSKIFEQDADPARICTELELISGKNISGGGTLLFLDEVQMCPKALSALRFFRETMPQIPVVAAGSLLDFALDDTQFPVGRVHFAELHPMTFCEYLEATGQDNLANLLAGEPSKLPDAVHDKLLDEVRMYSLVGGLPECVKTWAERHSLLETREIQNDLVAAFEQDFSKYPERMNASVLREIWRAGMVSVARQVSYAALSREHSGATNKKALELLEKARLVKISRSVASAALPFDMNVTPRIKIFAGDIGLFQCIVARPAEEALCEKDLMNVYNGALAEQFVAQELAAELGGGEPHWWKRDVKNAQAEVDFVVALNGRVQPIEVKSGPAGRLKSLHQFLKESPGANDGLVFSSAPYGTMAGQRLVFAPLYSVSNAIARRRR